MSDSTQTLTPRVDEFVRNVPPQRHYQWQAFAETLERELVAAQKRIAELEAERNARGAIVKDFDYGH
jgi:hypothetical protein